MSPETKKTKMPIKAISKKKITKTPVLKQSSSSKKVVKKASKSTLTKNLTNTNKTIEPNIDYDSKKSNKTSESKDKKRNIKGIGGWLIIPTIGLFLGAFVWVALFLLYSIIILLGESDLLAISYFLVSLIMSFLTIYSLVLEFGRKKEFPKWITITYISGFLATIILSLVDGDFSDVYGSTLGTIIWVWYFYVSVRVKNTFVN